MTAPARQQAATALRSQQSSDFRSEPVAERWRRAVAIRREWREWGLSTEPADRNVAEQVLSGIYARHYRRRPRFEWVDSPRQALRRVVGMPTLDDLRQWTMVRRPPGKPPLASDVAAGFSRLRSALDDSVEYRELNQTRAKRKNGEPWPVLPPLAALDAGVPFGEVLRQGIRNALWTTLATGFYLPVRAALGSEGGPVPVAWYGQQEAYWIAHYDALRRLGLARYSCADDGYLDDMATLARSCGWWWPGEQVCVVVERPAAIHTEPVPGAWNDEVRLRGGGGSAVEYRDGWRPRFG